MLTSPKSESIARERKTPLVFTSFKRLSHSYILPKCKDRCHIQTCLVLPCAKGIQRPGLYWWFVPRWSLSLPPPTKGAELADEGGTLVPWTSWSLRK